MTVNFAREGIRAQTLVPLVHVGLGEGGKKMEQRGGTKTGRLAHGNGARNRIITETSLVN